MGRAMLTYKAGYKFVSGGVHAQVVDFPAVISCADDLTEARRLLTAALLDVAETRLELGQSLPTPNASATDPEMDFEEPIYLHLAASSEIQQVPAGEVAS
jgi:predicted RNase H-like HicB family nuclease